MKPLRNGFAGFTLIEVLITLVISSLLMTAVFSIFDTSNKSYLLQEDIARLQQNVRVAKYYIEKDLRMTAYGVRKLGFDGELVNPIGVLNNVQDDANTLSSTDMLELMYIDDEAGDCGTVSAGKRACSDLPQLSLQGTKPPTSTVAEIKTYMKDNPPYSWWDEGCSCGGIDYDSPKFGFQVLITSPDGTMSDIVFVTGVSAKKEGSDSTISNGPNHKDENGITYSNKQLNTYPDGSTIKFFNSNSLAQVNYYVDSNYYLRRDINGSAVKIAENIEDIQLAFCGDYNGDGAVSLDFDFANPDDANDDWFDESDLVGGEMSTTDSEKIRFVRVNLLGRTAREHQGLVDSRPAIEDHASSIKKDGYHRRLISFTVKIRNLGLDD